MGSGRGGRRQPPARTGRGRSWRRQPPVGDPADPEGMAALITEHLEWLRTRAYSPHTVYHRDKSLRYFHVWCEHRSLGRPSEITKPILERYQRWLFYYRKPDGQPLTFRSQYLRLVDVRAFFKWLVRQNRILWNPAADLEMPKTEQRLPHNVLTAAEVERVFAQVDLGDALGIRDRAILETFYSTGIRRSELAKLELYDVDRARGVVAVRQGKGRKDRLVPIGERALGWVDRYLSESRPELVVPPDEQVLFLSNRGGPIEVGWLGSIVRAYVDRAELGKSGSCHLFRHTMATLMLENGADLRFIQAILGHAKITTTEVYTRVGIRKLREIHAATHPGARDEEGAARAELLEELEREASDDDG